MPFSSEWIEPEIALEYKGVTVYHVYKNDDWNNGRLQYWFTMKQGGYDCQDDFDVRSLANAMGADVALKPVEILKLGIDNGILENEMEQEEVKSAMENFKK
jgi:hypothetical protein